MRISVIVPCRNEAAHIDAFLQSALAQQLAPGDELEVVVADGRSDDGTAEKLAAWRARWHAGAAAIGAFAICACGDSPLQLPAGAALLSFVYFGLMFGFVIALRREHTAWVVFEDVFLVYTCLRSQAEMREIAQRRAQPHPNDAAFFE